MERALTMNAKWSSGIELGFECVGVSSLATVDSVAEIPPSSRGSDRSREVVTGFKSSVSNYSSSYCEYVRPPNLEVPQCPRSN